MLELLQCFDICITSLMTLSIDQVIKVALIGLNSLYGKASSLLLKLCPNIYNLRLYDESESDTSTADDIRIIDSPCKVEAYKGRTKLNDAIKGSDIVLIGDDVLSTPQTCFDVMAPKMQDYAKAIAESSPNALIIVAASPINKLVPVLSELLQENGYYDCNRVMGTTASYNIRANCILASYVNTDPRKVFLPVVGGDSEETIVPLFSQAKPHFNISEAVMKRLIEDIKQASPLIYETKGSIEALNKAHSTLKFLNSVIAGLRGEPNIMNIAFTKTTQVDGTDYFALPVLLGRFGIQARYGIPRILPFENDLIRESVFSLQRDIEFAKLFCKSRETAAETCSRNVSIRYRKSKEFEQFVNGLKIHHKGSGTEDKIANKIKPPIPVESVKSVEKPFDQKAFCLRHKSGYLEKNGIIPAYMRTGESIMPVNLGYTFGNDNGTINFLPKSSSAETPVCEPVLCPDKPKEREISFTNIVSFVENLVRKTTEKMINEKTNDERAFKDLESKKLSSEKSKNLKGSSEKDENLKLIWDKPENLNGGSRKLDMLKASPENTGSIESRRDEKNEYNCKCFGLTKNKTIPNKDSTTNIGCRRPISVGKINVDKNTGDKINSRKKKYLEKTIESIFRPSVATLKDRFESISEIKKCNHPKEFKQFGTKLTEKKQQNIVMRDEKHADIIEKMRDNQIKTPRLFNFKSDHQSSHFLKKIVHTNNTPTLLENNFYGSSLMNKIDRGKPKDKVKDFNKNQQILIPESDSCEQTLLNTTNVSKKKILVDDIDKTRTTNNSRNEARERLQSVELEEYNNKLDSLESIRNERLASRMTNLEKNKYVGNRTKTIFEKRDCIFDKMYNENDPLFKIKVVKNMKNILLGKINRSIEREKMFYDKINKRTYELLVERNSDGDTKRNVRKFKIPSEYKSCKYNKDFVKNKLRSKNTINKSINNKLDKSNKNNVIQINKTKNISTNSENKVFEEVKSVCYNAFLNDITQVNKAVVRHDVQVCSHLHNQSISKNKNNEKNSTVPFIKDTNLTTKPTQDTKQTYIPFQEKQSSVHDSKDLNMLMKTLDSDVFKSVDKINTNGISNDEVEQINTTKNYLNLKEEQKDIADIPTPNQEHKTELVQSEIKEKESPDLENSPTKHQTENPESTEMTFEEVIKEIKLALQPSNQENKSIDFSKQNKDEKSIPNVKIEDTDMNSKNDKEQINEGSASFQSKELILQNESSKSNKNIMHHSTSEKEGSVKSQTDLNYLKTPQINSVLQRLSQPLNKSSKNLNKCQNMSNTRTKVPCPTNNQKYFNNVSSTIPERFFSNKTRDGSKKNTKFHKGDSVSYIKSLRKALKPKGKDIQQRKIGKQGGLKVSIKNLNDLVIPVKSLKQQNASKKNPTELKRPSTPLSNYSKSFIISKYNYLNSKKKNVSKMQGFFSCHLGQKLNEINKAEHSFSLRDKNGINNYFLLKGLLPKDKHNFDDVNSNLSLLKTNVCNEDPFMSIKDKQKNKINLEKKTFVESNLKKKDFYLSNDGGNESGSLLITHNSVFSPNCPVNGFKPCLNAKYHKNIPISPPNKGNMSRINEAILSNLCRMCNKVSRTEKNSSHQLNQKTHNFKLFSTSALPMKNKSPSTLCADKRKTMKQVLMSKNETLGAKLPKGFIKKQRITKILEKDSRKLNTPKSSNYSHPETRAGENKVFSERNKAKINSQLLSQVLSKTTKIDENLFNPGFDSSYIERYLKIPTKYIPHRKLWDSKDYQQYKHSSKGRRGADIYKINWSNSHNNTHETKASSMSVENDILVRGTCLDHVRNKFVSNKCAKHELNNDGGCDEQKTVVNSMEPYSLSNAFVQYTKDFDKGEYPRNQKLPSIRQLHKCVFPSS